MKIDIKKNIESLLEHKKFKIREIDRRIGQRSVSAIIGGRNNNPSLHNLELIAEAFDITVQDLLNPTEKLSNNNDHNLKTHILNIKLYQSAVNSVVNEIESNTVYKNFDFEKVQSIIKDVYFYSSDLNIGVIDMTFVKWIIQNRLS